VHVERQADRERPVRVLLELGQVGTIKATKENRPRRTGVARATATSSHWRWPSMPNRLTLQGSTPIKLGSHFASQNSCHAS
jgi:hypothetical protein